ncbi:hypothetical protein QOZ98_001702 [Planomicrobium stackebrandtii]|uniref:Oligosaccharide repeat unit polymerase n=1 Tax=Planomicrobium stackebrandtii TaxID=253160 RepID=A0ABU0GWE6_9BACL|nr:hypothetical protein [Planomicrobium stackebrandtii]MDQ0428875.1 hypothetical protein [Planomicrobium stackebrandtii]
MEKHIEADDRFEKVLFIIVNLLTGISVIYYLLQAGKVFNTDDPWNLFILIIFSFKFIMDIYVFKVGFASFSLVLLFLPIISILGFGPVGEVQALFNDRTHLIEKHFYTLAFGALFFYYIWSILLWMTNKTYRNYDAKILTFYSGKVHSLLATWFFSALAIVSSIIYLPDLPGKAYHDLSPSLLPGNAWNSVVVISYFFVLMGVKGSTIRKFAILFVPFWLLSHYARVDILGLLLILYLLLTATKRAGVIKSKFSFKKAALIAGGLLVFSYLGLVRHSGLIFDVEAILDSVFILINYPTVQDLVYSTAAAIEVTHTYGNYYTLIDYIPQLIPSFFGIEAQSPQAAHLVASLIHTNYGLFVFGEYYLNYEIMGLILAPFATYAIIFVPAYVMKKLFGEFGMALGYYWIVLTIARVFWYGYIYYIKPLVIILPIFVIIYLVIASFEKDLVDKPALKSTEPH